MNESQDDAEGSEQFDQRGDGIIDLTREDIDDDPELQIDEGTCSENQDVLHCDVKVEIQISPSEENDVDAILDKLESGTSLMKTDVPVVSSSDTKDEKRINNGGVEEVGESSQSGPARQIIAEGTVSTVATESGSAPSQDVSITSSVKAMEIMDDLKSVCDASGSEGRNEVTSTTNSSFSPVRKAGGTLISWLRTKPASTRNKVWTFNCKVCDFSTESYSTLYGHFKRYHLRIIKCGKLSKYYCKIAGVIRKKTTLLFVCQHCNYVTLSKHGYFTHSSRRHPKRRANAVKNGTPVTSAENRKYLETLFKLDSTPIKYREKIKQLLVSYHSDSKVLIPNSDQQSHSQLRELKSDSFEESTQVCIICSEKFSSERLLHKHYRVDHPQQGPVKNAASNLFHCKLCGHAAVSRAALRLHYSRCHFLEAFYAWNVTSLEDEFGRRDRALQSTTHCSKQASSCFQDEKVLLENMDELLTQISGTWNENEVTDEQFASSDIPCVSCDFSTNNIIALFSHYCNSHDGCYPKGVKSLLFSIFCRHSRNVEVPLSEVHLVYGAEGGWLEIDGRITPDKTFKCQLCSSKYDRREDIEEHFANRHPYIDNSSQYIDTIHRLPGITNNDDMKPIFNCCVCKYTSNNFANDMEAHYMEHHPNVKFNISQLNNIPESLYVCEICTYKGTKESMQWHYAQCHDMLEVSEENLQLDTERKENLLVFSCFACQFSTYRKIDLAFHYERHHANDAITFTTPIYNDGYQCVMCKAITATLKGMIRHHKKHDNLGQNQTENPGKENTKTISCLACKHCRRVFANSHHLWSHIIKSHFKLSHLITVRDLSSHFLKYGFWENIQDECEESTGALAVFKSSKRSELNSDGEVVKKTQFAAIQPKKNNLIDGKRSTPFLGVNSNTKEHCSSTFNEKDRNGSKFRENPVPEVERKVQCKFCPLTTTHHQNLRRHLHAVHRHDVSFRCFSCSKETTSIAECVKHHLLIHGLGIGRSTALNFLLNDIVPSSGKQDKYTCCWCGYQGKSRTLVLNHLNSRHIKTFDRIREARKSSPLFCKWCKYYTRSSTSMQFHLKSKHDQETSFQSLLNLCDVESESSQSDSDNSDEEYMPSRKEHPHHQHFIYPQKSNFILNEECSFEDDCDFSHSEDYRSTHVRCKHQIRYPLLCKYCMTSFVCSTKFRLHAMKEHSHWCLISTKVKNIFILPDPKAIPRFLSNIIAEYKRNAEESIFYHSELPCESCEDRYFENPLLLQEHVFEEHNGTDVYMCRYCEYFSFDDTKVMLHNQQHSKEVRQRQISRESTRDQSVVVNSFAEEQTDATELNNTLEPPELDVDIKPDTPISEPSEVTPCVTHACDDSLKITIQKARKSTRRGQQKELVTNYYAMNCSEEDETCAQSGDQQEEEDVLTEQMNNFHKEHSVSHAGLIRCSKCKFHCTDPERMSDHVKATHISTNKYACKFCDFISKTFALLDDHLATFHKIKKNIQLGLQLKLSAHSNSVPYESAIQTISEMKSRFLYTPTPSLPIIRENVQYQSEGVGTSRDFGSSDTTDFDLTNANSRGRCITTAGSSMNEASAGLASTKCSYCGFVAPSTDKLEMHMKRHERNFQQDLGDLDGMNYNMNKMGIVHKF